MNVDQKIKHFWKWERANNFIKIKNKKLSIFRPFNTVGALERAKHAVESQYAVVGVLEDLNTTLSVFEKYIPRFFNGATEVYYGKYKKNLLIEKNDAKTQNSVLFIPSIQIKQTISTKSTRTHSNHQLANGSRRSYDGISPEKLNSINSVNKGCTSNIWLLIYLWNERERVVWDDGWETEKKIFLNCKLLSIERID